MADRRSTDIGLSGPSRLGQSDEHRRTYPNDANGSARLGRTLSQVLSMTEIVARTPVAGVSGLPTTKLWFGHQTRQDTSPTTVRIRHLEEGPTLLHGSVGGEPSLSRSKEHLPHASCTCRRAVSARPMDPASSASVGHVTVGARPGIVAPSTEEPDEAAGDRTAADRGHKPPHR